MPLPACPGVLFDQPQVIKQAEAGWEKHHASHPYGVADPSRVEFVSGSFFDGAAPPTLGRRGRVLLATLVVSTGVLCWVDLLAAWEEGAHGSNRPAWRNVPNVRETSPRPSSRRAARGPAR